VEPRVRKRRPKNFPLMRKPRAERKASPNPFLCFCAQGYRT
jgi:hypothetical protein